jgi:uncharacterized membrane protein YcaP (DUF421 family)
MDFLQDLVGRDPPHLSTSQMIVRAVTIFVIVLVFLRVTNRRFMGRYTAFDGVLSVILGSVVSRGINGAAPFGPTIAATAALLALHWACAELAFRSRAWRRLLRGAPALLVEHGVPRERALHRAQISAEELVEDLRYEGRVRSLDEVESAHLECNGRISVIRRDPRQQHGAVRSPQRA